MRETVLSRSMRLMFSGGLALGFGMLASAQAQEAAAPGGAQLQKVEITGTSIKRASIEGALPVQVIGRDEIQKMGVTSTEQLLTAISATSGAGGTSTAQGVSSPTYSKASVSLRALGASHTLVLVDGHRLAAYATDGSAVDVNTIPVSLIERVEVLKDGASGVYGSDAIGGVINFITRKNFTGSAVSTYLGGSRDGGGTSKKLGLVSSFGDYERDRYNLILSGDIDKEGDIHGNQRDYASHSWDDGGLWHLAALPSGVLSTFNPVTTPNANGVIPNALKNVGSEVGRPLSPNNCALNGSGYDPSDKTCYYNSAPVVTLVPQATRKNVAANFRFKVNEDTEFFMQGFASRNTTYTLQQPSPYSASALATDSAFAAQNIYPAIVIGPSNPAYQSVIAPWLAANKPALQGQSFTVSYRAFDGGGRARTDTADQSHLVLGLKGTLKSYDYDLAYTRNSSKVSEETEGGYQSQTALINLLSNNPAFNPFVQYQTPALAAQILATNYNGPIMDSKLTNDLLDGKISGEIMALPAGQLSFAAGASLHKESLNFQPSAAFQSHDISGFTAQALPLSASRRSASLFGELDVPILKSLEADIAVRTDHYPNATSTNPKVSFRFQPAQQALFRASYGTGFREPSLPELFTANTVINTTNFRDPVTGRTEIWTQTIGGNAQLKPETSEQTSFGAVIDPVKGLSFSIDYYKIRIGNLVTALNPIFIVAQAATGNPAYTGLVQRDSIGNITNVTATNINAGSEKTSGVDVDLRWQIAKTADYGSYNLHLNGTYVSTFDLQLPDGTIQHNVAATVGPTLQPLNAVSSGGIISRWKHKLNLGWTAGDYALDLAQNYQSAYWDNVPYKTGQTTAHRVGALTLWDIQASYRGIKNLSLSAGVKNLFNRNPPYIRSFGQYNQAGYDPTYYDPHSQFGYVSASYSF